jgi:hypothetical protein
MTTTSRGKYLGELVGDAPIDEVDHFIPVPGLWRMD